MTYVIGEVGQNHQGSVEVARDIIDMAASPSVPSLGVEDPQGVDAVKLCWRDLEHECTAEMMARPYEGRNSFGATYREHREALELSDAEHEELYHHAREHGLDLIETICHPNGVDRLLGRFTPDAVKTASRDLTNLPLIDALAATGLPLILSTGMHGRRAIDRALQVATQHHTNITIFHCVSSYPCPTDDLHLQAIEWLRETYPYRIGFSDHHIGVWSGASAVAHGAEVLEKHVTLYRGMAGSDQQGSLGPEGLWRYVKYAKEASRARGASDPRPPKSVEPAQRKLERSVASARDLAAGETVRPDDIELLSPGCGIPWHEREKVVGKKVKHFVPAQTLLAAEDVESC